MPVGIFSYEPNGGIYFQENYYFFLKNDFVENILQRKTFMSKQMKHYISKSS
jgi:hypothetical protein